MTEETQPEPATVRVNENELAQFVVTNALESGQIDALIPRMVNDDEVWDGVLTRNVDHVDSYGDRVEVQGEFTVREAVGRIPASGGGRLEPPTNPPETIYEDRKAHFSLVFEFEDLGHAYGSIEVE
jgi:hypothetical protein